MASTRISPTETCHKLGHAMTCPSIVLLVVDFVSKYIPYHGWFETTIEHGVVPIISPPYKKWCDDDDVSITSPKHGWFPTVPSLKYGSVSAALNVKEVLSTTKKNGHVQ